MVVVHVASGTRNILVFLGRMAEYGPRLTLTRLPHRYYDVVVDYKEYLLLVRSRSYRRKVATPSSNPASLPRAPSVTQNSKQSLRSSHAPVALMSVLETAEISPS